MQSSPGAKAFASAAESSNGPCRIAHDSAWAMTIATTITPAIIASGLPMYRHSAIASSRPALSRSIVESFFMIASARDGDRTCGHREPAAERAHQADRNLEVAGAQVRFEALLHQQRRFRAQNLQVV